MKLTLIVLVASALATGGCLCCPNRPRDSSNRYTSDNYSQDRNSSDYRTGTGVDRDSSDYRTGTGVDRNSSDYRTGTGVDRNSGDYRTGTSGQDWNDRSDPYRRESTDSSRLNRSDWSTPSSTSLDADRNRTRSTLDTTRPTFDSTTDRTDVTEKQPDNSAVNQRDRDGITPTPTDQSSNEADVNRTAMIRRRIMDSDLSIKAQNVKVISQNGRVTLRGPVDSQFERDEVARIAREVAGTTNVENLIEVVMAR